MMKSKIGKNGSLHMGTGGGAKPKRISATSIGNYTSAGSSMTMANGGQGAQSVGIMGGGPVHHHQSH
jgi:hypothetical protein